MGQQTINLSVIYNTSAQILKKSEKETANNLSSGSGKKKTNEKI